MQMPEALNMPLYGFSFSNSNAKLVMERQPKKRGYRFRYASEGKTHGMLPGEVDVSKKEQEKKVFPTIKLENHRGPAKVVMTLVTDQQDYMHPHTLLVNKSPVPGYHVFEIQAGAYRLELKSIAIQHVIKEKLQETLMDRILQTKFMKEYSSPFLNPYGSDRGQVDVNTYINSLRDREASQGFFDRKKNTQIQGDQLEQLRAEARGLSKRMTMSSCKLCFVTFLQDSSGKFTHMLEPTYSDIIIDGKKKEGAPLKIIRTSHVACSVEGGKEIWLLSDKVDAEDTEIYFFEKKENKDEIYWEGLGEFNKTDVYKQALIVFKTPRYIDQNIDQPKSVSMLLRRKKDKECVSDVHQFMYKPKHYDRYGLREKRRKQLPEGLYGSSPAKRPAIGTEYPALFNGDSSQRSPENPAADTENPSLSDFLLHSLKGESAPLNGNIGGGSSHAPTASSSGAFNFPMWPNSASLSQLGQLVSNYPAPSDSGDDSRGS